MLHRPGLTAVSALVLLASTSCMFVLDTDSLQEATPDVAAEACTSMAQAYCSKYDSCASFYLRYYFGDVEACVERFKLGCRVEVDAAGSATTPDAVRECAKTIEGFEGCSEVMGGSAWAICAPPPGPRKVGERCVASGQCATSYCELPSGSVCGTCSERVPKDGACNSLTDCVPPFVCSLGGLGYRCVMPLALGDACGEGKPQCAAGLACRWDPGNPGLPPTCKPPLAEGEPCFVSVQAVKGSDESRLFDELTRECDFLHGAFCYPPDPDTNPPVNGYLKGECRTFLFAASDGASACGQINMNLVLCEKSGTCQAPEGSALEVCMPAPDEKNKGVCATDADCLSPSVCVSTQCVLRDPSGCAQ